MNFKSIFPLLLSCFSILYYQAFGQELPKIVPPTPEAASLFKYLDYPVDYATGIPQINIPLYTVQSGSISVPISINYHSSGRKVYDETGAIGLGWTLAAGGMISRTIYGDPDDNDYTIKFPVPWKKQADVDAATAAGADFLEGVSYSNYPNPVTWYDTEYDFFSYSANSISGKFVFRDDNNVKSPVLIPKKPYKVEYHKATIQSNINYFDYLTIIDDKGVTYRFGKSLKDGTAYYETSGTAAKNSWLLTEIVSADKVDTVFFKYQAFSRNKRTVSQKTTVTDHYANCFEGGYIPPYEFTVKDGLGTTQDVNFEIQRIIEIKFRNGKVQFNLESGGDVIQSIQVRNLKNEIIRTIEFNQSLQDLLSDGNASTKKLNSVIIKDANNSSSEKYAFDYYPTLYASPSYQVVEARYQDLWGYYNSSGQLEMRPLITGVDAYHHVSGLQYIAVGDENSNRAPSLEPTKSGVLKRITFPTGGSSEFIYELNKYKDPATQQVNYSGGLRLYQTITNDGSSSNLTKTYAYGVAESGYGTLPLIPNKENMSYETKHQNFKVQEGTCANTCTEMFFRQRIFSADVLPIFSEFHQKPVYYEEITEYLGTASSNVGKSVYKYDMGNQFGLPSSVQNLFSNSDLKHWKQSSLIEKRDYKNISNSYQLVKKTINTYTETVYSGEKVWGLHVGKYIFITPTYFSGSVPSYRYTYPGCGSICGSASDVFKFADYTISVGKKELSSTLETLYDNNGAEFASTTSYVYNANHLLNTSTKTGSNLETVVTENKYPFDFLSESVFTEMVNRNMLNYEIETNNYRNSTPLTSIKTTYKDWGTNRIKPEIVSTKQGTGAYEQRAVFYGYDEKGNIQCVSKANGPKISYLYGYSKELPIAEVKNANNTKYQTTQVVQTTGTQSVNFGGPTSGTIQTTKTFTVDYTGNVYLKLGVSGSPSYSTVANYSGITSDYVTLATGGCGLTTVTFSGVTPGTYTLTITLTTPNSGVTSLGACGQIDYPQNSIVVNTYGFDEAFYENFEEGSATGTATPHTGLKYLVGDYACTFAIPNARTYVIEYWYYDTDNAWKYISKPYTGAGMFLSEGSAIDNVRIYPSDALMTSYTYLPLIGISSSIDENGNVLYYDYDTFGRLWRIRNDKGGIEKQYTYNYKN